MRKCRGDLPPQREPMGLCLSVFNYLILSSLSLRTFSSDVSLFRSKPPRHQSLSVRFRGEGVNPGGLREMNGELAQAPTVGETTTTTLFDR